MKRNGQTDISGGLFESRVVGSVKAQSTQTDGCVLQRMVYPERLELDSVVKPNTGSPPISWCNESQLCDFQEAGHRRRPTGTT